MGWNLDHPDFMCCLNNLYIDCLVQNQSALERGGSFIFLPFQKKKKKVVLLTLTGCFFVENDLDIQLH